MILSTGLTLANWTSKPITQVGWIKALYTYSSLSYTFAIDTTTGINTYFAQQMFQLPPGQGDFNATVGKCFTTLVPSFNISPAFIDCTITYQIDENNRVHLNAYIGGDGGEDGSGNSEMRFYYPYETASGPGSNQGVIGSAYVKTPTLEKIAHIRDGNGEYGILYWENPLNTMVQMLSGDFPDGNRQVILSMTYMMRDNP